MAIVFVSLLLLTGEGLVLIMEEYQPKVKCYRKLYPLVLEPNGTRGTSFSCPAASIMVSFLRPGTVSRNKCQHPARCFAVTWLGTVIAGLTPKAGPSPNNAAYISSACFAGLHLWRVEPQPKSLYGRKKYQEFAVSKSGRSSSVNKTQLQTDQQ